MTDTLLLDQPLPGVHVITFNRPQAHNALDVATMQAFAAQISACATKADLRALILTGAGTAAFCSGADLVDMSTRPTATDALEMITIMGDALRALERLPIPVIAAVNGYALGGGSEIALACDLRVVDETARFGFVQIKRGVVPGWGGGQRLLRLVGYPRALEWLVRGQALKAPELLAAGLANRVAPAGQALSAALELAGEIAAQDADAVRALKTLLQAGLNQPYETALMTERSLFPPLWEGETQVRTLQAFLNKRT
ncbi:MAG: enoyl-CoA hydratase/isomerase family protein [Chloroflexi bacterium]|uniref:enoyl-CoA hydratase/isomerase family protein n=1 Tax=Candidatus Flexifilum breve TaxID=3140694 RepID=UPI00313716AE|nr:enoyl-CoA hydratase/isomerase family protein [Chloroflexota bacterium]